MIKIYVLDTNTVISAIFWPDSIPALAVKKAQLHTVAVSQAVIDEWNEVIRRPKFDKLKPLAIRLALLEELISDCQLTSVINPVQACRDPKDDKFLEVASAANATLIVSGDKDLLDLIIFDSIPIITAREFLETP